MNVLITKFSGFVHSSLLLEDPLPTIRESWRGRRGCPTYNWAPWMFFLLLLEDRLRKVLPNSPGQERGWSEAKEMGFEKKSLGKGCTAHW